jgi:hypothetical protein
MKFWITPKDRYTQGSAQRVAENIKEVIEDWNDSPPGIYHPHCSGAVLEWRGRKYYIPKDCSTDEIEKRLKGEIWTTRDFCAIVTLLGVLVFLGMVGWAAVDLVLWLI